MALTRKRPVPGGSLARCLRAHIPSPDAMCSNPNDPQGVSGSRSISNRGGAEIRPRGDRHGSLRSSRADQRSGAPRRCAPRRGGTSSGRDAGSPNRRPGARSCGGRRPPDPHARNAARRPGSSLRTIGGRNAPSVDRAPRLGSRARERPRDRTDPRSERHNGFDDAKTHPVGNRSIRRARGTRVRSRRRPERPVLPDGGGRYRRRRVGRCQHAGDKGLGYHRGLIERDDRGDRQWDRCEPSGPARSARFRTQRG
jgi:hypothetical protein